jgi:hypothetical protein
LFYTIIDSTILRNFADWNKADLRMIPSRLTNISSLEIADEMEEELENAANNINASASENIAEIEVGEKKTRFAKALVRFFFRLSHLLLTRDLRRNIYRTLKAMECLHGTPISLPLSLKYVMLRECV